MDDVTRVNNLKLMKLRRQELRKNQTMVEQLLWSRLRRSQMGYKFKRQFSIGPYVVDFYCPGKKLAVELDGGQHIDRKQYDEYRSEYFSTMGIRVIRYWNNQVTQEIDNVIDDIQRHLED
ncbi:hypothetical protein A2368_04295 [Candidatus Collierbacteria bacterium RIFOXYB1_FULL_49_13]|uniref:DUF559 domain-containing protein n=1 Tax=Candidatus Collierbacteria bacterium RIFOXYB1_FULL_49_13 TaxID=1817728 RepID=A0A1F5FGP2_9BACT|nr:MAG: hypothetical protein A2368_04295 [Candidatus Collierbacteria bacterium RIFOXYB1_FULL_49_13]